MRYTYNDIEKFMEFKTWTDKQKIDKLLEIDCGLYAHLGIDSSKNEKEEVKRKSLEIYRIIKTIDKKLGDELLYSEDLKK
mgnify:CR=1 FL=1|tara:strand:- start:954 stop:1193 length:240 start_codon:yes stop_codon:yes gene_type:complete